MDYLIEGLQEASQLRNFVILNIAFFVATLAAFWAAFKEPKPIGSFAFIMLAAGIAGVVTYLLLSLAVSINFTSISTIVAGIVLVWILIILIVGRIGRHLNGRR